MKLFFLKAIFFSLMLSFGLSLSAKINEIACIAEVRDYLSDKHSNHLIVLDIDNVTMHPVDGVGSVGSDEWWTQLISNRQLLAPTKHINEIVYECLPLLHEAYMTVDSKLVEEEIRNLIENLQSQGYMVMALTARSIQFAQRTATELLRLGVDFSESAPVKNPDELNMPENTCYLNGMIFCGIANKGHVLSHVFDASGYVPVHVTFIDDKLKNLEHVQKALEIRTINFQGLRYGYLDEKIQMWQESLNNERELDN